MTSRHVLVVTDSAEATERLAGDLLPGAGYVVTEADDFTSPPDDVDVVVVDVTRLRSMPMARLAGQRRMGCIAPALLIAPRVTDEMMAEIFELGVRDYVAAPAEPQVILSKVQALADLSRSEETQNELQNSLNRARDDINRRLEEMNALTRIGRSITSLTEVDTILSHIVEAAVYLTKADEGAIFLQDDDTGRVTLRAEMGFHGDDAQAIVEPSADSDVMAVMQTGQPILRTAQEEHKVKTGYIVRAMINAPVIVNGIVIGVLGVYSHGDKEFAYADQIVVVNLADFAAIALDKIRSVEQFASKVDEGLETAHLVMKHAETFHDPIEGIESLADTLLAEGYGPINEQQQTAIQRIKNATIRLLEVDDLIQQTIREFQDNQ